MIGPNFIDEIDCGSFFDTIDDLLDFPNDDVESGLGPASDCNAAFNNSLWPNQSGSLPAPNDAVFSAGNSASDLSAELSVPIEDIVQLEWLSNFVEDSFSGGSLTINKPDSFINKDTSHHQFQTSSPISVLDSSSSCSGDKNVPQSPGPIAAPGKRGRARSKRLSPATFNPRSAIQLISPASSVTEAEGPQAQPFLAPKVPSDSENFAESRPVIKIPKQASGEQKKKKKLKVSLPLAPLEGNQNSGPTQAAVRKCLHCEITKTPQWRAGPMGPKTLCNACGVRYKSGRLFPEYRPAASPTFVPSLHSNSHKKVLEMRTKGGELVVFGETATAMNETPELIPNTNSSISMDYM
ncbi:PREDICTED: GATA transcription factor 8 [Prunus mume]|uniref:GATA transcription factor n=1 Tax=Prunus mume TaxID=102107 RepID=A0ABM0P251_PRUMU|nr:PREDICTED: GATA transcription factor 8 [Prunus mume]XP_008233317.1 PREDICTED: GATA transcription factor 8 [Prunus mume]